MNKIPYFLILFLAVLYWTIVTLWLSDKKQKVEPLWCMLKNCYLRQQCVKLKLKILSPRKTFTFWCIIFLSPWLCFFIQLISCFGKWWTSWVELTNKLEMRAERSLELDMWRSRTVTLWRIWQQMILKLQSRVQEWPSTWTTYPVGISKLLDQETTNHNQLVASCMILLISASQTGCFNICMKSSRTRTPQIS